MAINYAKMSALAQKLISENGRTITLVKFQPSQDIATPWKSNTTNPIGSQLVKNAAVVQSSTLLGTKQVNDDMLKRVSHVGIFACNGDTLEGYDALIDSLDSKQYSIEFVQELTPATTPLIAYIGFNR
jgi:hypothetical protein